MFGNAFFPQSVAVPVYFHQIYVGDIPITLSEEQIYFYFQTYGKILYLKTGINRKSKKFAFISYDHQEAVDRALKNANSTVIEGHLLRVDTVKNIRQYSLEANLFFKCSSLELTSEGIKSLFAKFGKIASFKLVSRENKSLGYGYLQFENKEIAEKCLKNEENAELREAGLEVVQFVPRNNRETRKNNLYVKIPYENLEKEQVAKLIDDVFGEIGKISSKLIDFDKNTKRLYAFVCYEITEDADRAIEKINSRNLLNLSDENPADSDKIAISRVLGRQDLNENKSLYTKNLKLSVTSEQLKAEFSKFGEITRISILKPKSFSAATLSAIIAYKNSEDAKDAIIKSLEDKSLHSLYEKQIFITFLQSKDQRNKYLQVSSRSKKLFPGNPDKIEPVAYGFPPQSLVYAPQMNYNMGFLPTNAPMMGFPQQTMQPQFANFNNNPMMMGKFNQKMPGNTNYQGNNPNYQGNNPNFQGNNPNYQGNNPNFQGNNPNYQGNNPNFQGNSSPMYTGQNLGKMGNTMMGNNPNYVNSKRNFGQPQGNYHGDGNNPQQQMGMGSQRQPYQQNYNRPRRGGGYRGNYGNRPNNMGNRQDSGGNYRNRQHPAESQLTRENLDNLTTQQTPMIPQPEINPILKQSLEDFLKNDTDYQRNYLGTLLYPMVVNRIGSELAPKITGMLIDFDNFSVSDILELIDSETALTEAISEAKNVILKSMEQAQELENQEVEGD